MSFIDELQENASALGLECELRHPLGMPSLQATGELDGRSVRVDASAQGKTDSTFVLMAVALARELDLGLHVRRNTFALGGGIGVDYPGFEAEHHVSADEPERARLLLDASVCKRLVAVADLGGDLGVTDARVSAKQGAGFTELAPMLHALCHAARALDERYLALPPAGPLREATGGWAQHAARTGMRFTPCPFVLEGPLESARTRRTGPGSYVTDVAVRLVEPLDVDLKLRPARRLELLWEIFAGADVQLGDAPFDRAFTIAARDPAAAAVVLDAAVREQIMALRRDGDVHLGSHGMTLRTTHFAEVPAALDRMRSILDLAAVNARNRGHVGPYR